MKLLARTVLLFLRCVQHNPPLSFLPFLSLSLCLFSGRNLEGRGIRGSCWWKQILRDGFVLRLGTVYIFNSVCVHMYHHIKLFLSPLSPLLPHRNLDGMSLVSGTQLNTTVTFSTQPGPNVPPTTTATRSAESLPPSHHHPLHGLPHHHHHHHTPIMSPPDSGLGCTSSSLPPSATSPTMTDVFGLPTPPLSLGTGRSRSPSPLTLIQAPSNKPFAAKPVMMWNKHDVADWLESLNLGEHRDAFMENDIEGSHLPSLQKEDMIDLGVTRVGHRMNIERALKVLLDRWE